MPKTQSSVAEILEQLHALHAGEQVNEFGLARLKKQIDALQTIDRAGYLSLSGCYYAHLGEKERSLMFHETAAREYPQNSSVYSNYAVSLSQFGEGDKALGQGLKAYQLDKTNPDYLSHIIIEAYLIHADDVLEKYIPIFHKLTGQNHEVVAWLDEDKQDEQELPGIIAEADKAGYVPLAQLKQNLGW